MRLFVLSLLAATTAAPPVSGATLIDPAAANGVAAAEAPAAVPTEEQFEALQSQINELRRQLEAKKNEPVVAPMVTVGVEDELPPPPVAPVADVTMELSNDVEELMAWRKSLEESEAKAAAKAALKPNNKISGRFFLDAYNYDQNVASVASAGDAQNTVQFRTVWLTMGGDVLENTSYRIWVDVTGGDVKLLDVYLDFAELPVLQNVRIGNFFEPFGMEQLTPNIHLTFMERSSVFNLGRHTGIMAHSDDENANWTYGAGVFVSEHGNAPIEFQDDNDAAALTGRLTWCPWYDEATAGRGVFHLGAAYSYRVLADDNIRFRNRPESFAAPFVVDTGTVGASSYQLVGLEAAYAYGPWMVQSEYHGATVNELGPANDYLDSFYIQTSYFLTGENRYYNRRSGTFANAIVPIENFFRVRTGDCDICTGLGAWEVAYRYATTDLNAGSITGGLTDLHAVGLNWYLSPYTRAMFDYIHSETDTLAANDGVLNALQMRLQYNF